MKISTLLILRKLDLQMATIQEIVNAVKLNTDLVNSSAQVTDALIAEVKARGDGEGFKTLERWLGTHDALFLWRDRAAPLVLVPLHVWLELIGRGLPPPQVKS